MNCRERSFASLPQGCGSGPTPHMGLQSVQVGLAWVGSGGAAGRPLAAVGTGPGPRAAVRIRLRSESLNLQAAGRFTSSSYRG